MRALVLSGAAAGIFAHGGAIRALAEARLDFDLVVGASAGAIAGALYAAGRASVIEDLAATSSAEVLFGDDGFGLAAAIRRLARFRRTLGALSAERLDALIARHLDDEALSRIPPRGLAVPAVDVLAGRERVFWPSDGPEVLRAAIRGSAALPGALPPVPVTCRDGSNALLFDAGVVSNVPTRLAAYLARASGDTSNLVVVVCALQPPETGPLPGEGLGSALEAGSRLVSLILHQQAQAARETLERLAIPFLWIQIEPLNIDLSTFGPGEAMRAFETGHERAHAALSRGWRH